MNALCFCSDPNKYTDNSLKNSLASLNQLKNKAFGRKKYEDVMKNCGATYNKKVLHGNWFEERAEYIPPPDEQNSSYNTCYQTCEDKQALHAKQAEEEVHEKAGNQTCEDNEDEFSVAFIRKKQLGIGPTLIQHHGNEYRNNFSTCYDLSYRVLPKGLKGPRLRVFNARKDSYTPEVDLTKNFGNSYGYGLKEYILSKSQTFRNQQEEELDKKDSLRTNYQCEFSRKPLSFDTKRFPLGVKKNTPPDLRALGIDVNAPWSRIYTHGFHRMSLCQRARTCG